MSIEWVLFDMGGVLVDDQPAMLLLYRRLYERCNGMGCIKGHDELLSLREGLIAEGDGRHWVTAMKMLLSDDWLTFYKEIAAEIRRRYIELNRPFPGIGEVLSWAAGKFSIGLAANQFTDCRILLEARGWINHFKLLGISEEMGHKKPEVEFFQWILDNSGARPENCIMIGDRIDNDISPAKSLGLRTIWYQPATGYEFLEPDDDFTRAYIESHKRASLFTITPSDDSQQPDVTACTPGELMDGIKQIARI